MKKIILAAAILLTTGAVTVVASKNDNVKQVKIVKLSVPSSQNLLGTAD